jgi:hypothetical protein
MSDSDRWPTLVSTLHSHGRDYRVIRPRDQEPGIALSCYQDMLLLDADRARWKMRQTRNCVTIDTAGETLFVVGNRDGFRLTGNFVSRFEAADGWLMDVYGGRRRSGTGRHGTPGRILIESLAGS